MVGKAGLCSRRSGGHGPNQGHSGSRLWSFASCAAGLRPPGLSRRTWSCAPPHILPAGGGIRRWPGGVWWLERERACLISQPSSRWSANRCAARAARRGCTEERRPPRCGVPGSEGGAGGAWSPLSPSIRASAVCACWCLPTDRSWWRGSRLCSVQTDLELMAMKPASLQRHTPRTGRLRE